MDNSASFDAVARATFSSRFVRPLYESYCFSRIPATVRRLLGLGSGAGALPEDVLPRPGAIYDCVVLVVLDAFGWRFFEKWREGSRLPPLRELSERGVVSKITAQFPSTTSAHITTLHSGETPNRSGIYEWYQYIPAVDDMVCPLTFSFARDRGPGTLVAAGVRPEDVLPRGEAVERLADAGVEVVLWNDRGYSESTYNVHMRGRAAARGFRSYVQGLEDLRNWIEAGAGKRYGYLYVADFDSACHVAGPDSFRVECLAQHFFQSLEEKLLAPLAGKARGAILLFTADHGQVELLPSRAVYIDRDYPYLAPQFRTNARGETLAPAGSRRDFFIHAAPGREEILLAELRARFEGRAEVYSVPDLIAEGFFGPGEASPRFLERVGDLVILPYRQESIFWLGAGGRFHERFLGHHGGLTRDEMESVFVALELG